MAGIVIPVAGVSASQLSDTFGANRSGGRSHKGIDIFAEQGTAVVAARGGTVVKAGDSGGLGGLRVWVRDDDGMAHYYAHMDSVDVREGQRVEAGAKLGGVGTTGNARNTPPHLHYSVNRAVGPEDDTVNPYEYLTGAETARLSSQARLATTSGGGAPEPQQLSRQRSRDVMASIMSSISQAASQRGGEVLDAKSMFTGGRGRTDEPEMPATLEGATEPDPVGMAPLGEPPNQTRS